MHVNHMNVYTVSFMTCCPGLYHRNSHNVRNPASLLDYRASYNWFSSTIKSNGPYLLLSSVSVPHISSYYNTVMDSLLCSSLRSRCYEILRHSHSNQITFLVDRTSFIYFLSMWIFIMYSLYIPNFILSILFWIFFIVFWLFFSCFFIYLQFFLWFTLKLLLSHRG